MSEYYDEGPYTIDQWNALIRDVNEILENPPEDTTCEPVEPLEEVEDPHIWAVTDIEEVREALEETCPEITFTTELVKWKAEIIDEIETEMAKAWCDCEGDSNCQTFSDSVPGGWTWASPEGKPCCGEMTEDDISVLCPAPASQTVWLDTMYPKTRAQNVILRDAAYAQATIASTGTYDYTVAWNKMMTWAEDIEDLQSDINTLVTTVDNYIEQYEDCLLAGSPSVCEPIKQNICLYGTIAKEKQTELNELVSDLMGEESQLDSHKTVADAAGLASMNLLLAMQPRFPADKNFTGTLVNAFPSQKDWARLVYARPGGWVATVTSTSNTTEDIVGWGKFWGNQYIHVTPGGNIYARVFNLHLLVTETQNFYWRKEVRWRCEHFGSHTCPDPELGEVAACDWMSWQMDWVCGEGNFYEDWGGGSCARDSSENPMIKSDGNSSSISGSTCVNASNADYTAMQEEFRTKYTDWYTEYPKYDDRHEEYC